MMEKMQALSFGFPASVESNSASFDLPITFSSNTPSSHIPVQSGQYPPPQYAQSHPMLVRPPPPMDMYSQFSSREGVIHRTPHDFHGVDPRFNFGPTPYMPSWTGYPDPRVQPNMMPGFDPRSLINAPPLPHMQPMYMASYDRHDLPPPEQLYPESVDDAASKSVQRFNEVLFLILRDQ